MKTYALLSGEIIASSNLSQKEQEQISEIERMIANKEDYFTIDRLVHAPLMEGRAVLQAKDLIEIYNSPGYKITSDLLTRYHHQLFTK